MFVYDITDIYEGISHPCIAVQISKAPESILMLENDIHNTDGQRRRDGEMREQTKMRG